MGPHLALCQLYPLAIPGARGVRMGICISLDTTMAKYT